MRPLLVAVIAFFSPPAWAEIGNGVGELKIDPPEVEFRAVVGESKVIAIEITAPPGTTEVETVIAGYPCDRRLTSKGAGRWLIELAPETHRPVEHIRATLSVIARPSGIARVVHVGGSVGWPVEVSPVRIFLGTLPADGRQIRQIIRLSGGTPGWEVTGVDAGAITGATATFSPAKTAGAWVQYGT